MRRKQIERERERGSRQLSVPKLATVRRGVYQQCSCYHVDPLHNAEPFRAPKQTQKQPSKPSINKMIKDVHKFVSTFKDFSVFGGLLQEHLWVPLGLRKVFFVCWMRSNDPSLRSDTKLFRKQLRNIIPQCCFCSLLLQTLVFYQIIVSDIN